MYRSNRDGVFTYVNDSLARLLGYSVAELMTKNLNTEIHADPSARAKLIATYFPQRIVDGAQVQWRTRDGRILTVQIWGHAVETNGDWSFDASVLDVTEVTRQRVELERTARILDLVVQQMPALYWVVDKELRIIRTGGAIEALLGYPRSTASSRARSIRCRITSARCTARRRRTTPRIAASNSRSRSRRIARPT